MGDLGDRYRTGFGEFDRVLGGGLMAGAVVLLGGDPGVGKSTLLQQVSASLPSDLTVCYASGEESLRQIGQALTDECRGRPALGVVAPVKKEEDAEAFKQVLLRWQQKGQETDKGPDLIQIGKKKQNINN